MFTQEIPTTFDISYTSKDVTVVTLFGKIDFKCTNTLRSQIMVLTQSNPKFLVIDMENVNFIDSSGLGLLISVLKEMRSKGGKLVLSGISKYVSDLLDITNTNKLFETCSAWYEDFEVFPMEIGNGFRYDFQEVAGN